MIKKQYAELKCGDLREETGMEENTNTTQENTVTEETSPAETEAKAEEKAAPAEKDVSEEPAKAETVKDEPKEKTFTQGEVDEIVRKRLARAAKDGQSAAAENALLKNQLACYKAGIKSECVEDAVTLAKAHVDDKTDFDGALAAVLKKYPYLGGESAKKSTSVDMGQNKSDMPDDMAAVRKIFGI